MRVKWSFARPAGALLCAVGPLLSACSKTIEWEEEVLLNTRETLWIRRADTFARQTEPGNPLKPAWWPEARRYDFDYHGRRYVYEVLAKQSPGPMAIHVEADGAITIIDHVKDCKKPGLAEWRWGGGQWQLQPDVSPALFGTSRNLMAWRSPEGDIPSRVSIATKERLDYQPRTARHVDELYSLTAASGCTGRK